MDNVSELDPRFTELLTTIQSLTRTRHEGVTFEEQDVFLDGRDFIGCTFRNCRMYLFVGVVHFSGNVSFINCAWLLGGPAEGAVSLLDFARQTGVDNTEGPVQVGTQDRLGEDA